MSEEDQTETFYDEDVNAVATGKKKKKKSKKKSTVDYDDEDVTETEASFSESISKKKKKKKKVVDDNDESEALMPMISELDDNDDTRVKKKKKKKDKTSADDDDESEALLLGASSNVGITTTTADKKKKKKKAKVAFGDSNVADASESALEAVETKTFKSKMPKKKNSMTVEELDNLTTKVKKNKNNSNSSSSNIPPPPPPPAGKVRRKKGGKNNHSATGMAGSMTLSAVFNASEQDFQGSSNGSSSKNNNNNNNNNNKSSRKSNHNSSSVKHRSSKNIADPKRRALAEAVQERSTRRFDTSGAVHGQPDHNSVRSSASRASSKSTVKKNNGSSSHVVVDTGDVDLEAGGKDDKKDKFTDEDSLGAEESLSPSERAELTEKHVKKGLLFTCLGAIGLLACAKLISWIVEKVTGPNVEDVADDAAALAATGAPPPTPNGTVVSQMAVQSAQNAATATATGTQAAAAVAVAASAATAATTATTVAAVGVATVVAATGVYAGGAAAGVFPNPFPLVIPNPLAIPQAPAVWSCRPSIQPVSHTGSLVLYMDGVPKTWLDEEDKRKQLQDLFIESYNSKVGGCDSTFMRILETATLLQEPAYEELFDPQTNEPFFMTHWNATVWCHNCHDFEPLFFEFPQDLLTTHEVTLNTSARPSALPDVASDKAQNMTARPAERYLEEDESSPGIKLLEDFADDYSQSITDLIQETEVVVDVFHGLSLNVYNGSDVESFGTSIDILGGEGAGASEPAEVGPCPSETVLSNYSGYFGMVVENMNCNMSTKELDDMNKLVLEVYNKVGRACDGPLSRVMTSAEFVQCSVSYSADPQPKLYASTRWLAQVHCDGCSDPEPLFKIDYPKSRNLRGRELQVEHEDSFLGQFAGNMTAGINNLVASSGLTSGITLTGKLATVVFAETFSTEDEATVMESTGEPVSGGLEPPVCLPDNAADTSFETGKVQLIIENLSNETVDLISDESRESLGKIFQTRYNDESGMCEGLFERVIHNATLQDITFGFRGDGTPYAVTVWEALTSCQGCDEADPLFFNANADVNEGRMLQDVPLAVELQDFADKLGLDLDARIKELVIASNPAFDVADWKQLLVIYAATLDSASDQMLQEIGTTLAEYLATANIFDQLSSCRKDLVVADKNGDSMMDEDEYAPFVHELMAELTSADRQVYQKLYPTFEKLPQLLQDNFASNAEGGEIPIGGDKAGQKVSAAQEAKLEALCTSTSDLVVAEFASDSPSAAPTANTTGPPEEVVETEAPATEAPTTEAPTETAETTAPPELTRPPLVTAAPTSAPTETPRVDLDFEMEFVLGDDIVDREPTEEELTGVRDATETYLTKWVVDSLKDDPIYKDTVLVSHDLTITEHHYYPTPPDPTTGYSHRIVYQSLFLFTGKRPSAAEIYKWYEQIDLTVLASEAVWKAEPGTDGLFFATEGLKFGTIGAAR